MIRPVGFNFLFGPEVFVMTLKNASENLKQCFHVQRTIQHCKGAVPQ